MTNMNWAVRIRQSRRYRISFRIFYHNFEIVCKNKFFIAETRCQFRTEYNLFLSEANPAIRYNSSAFKLFFYCFSVASVGRPKKQRKISFQSCGVFAAIRAKNSCKKERFFNLFIKILKVKKMINFEI
jgi:hypothetical protein